MNLFKNRTFKFMSKQMYAFVFSIVLVTGSILSLALQGLSLGIDFTGGTQIEVGFSGKADLNKIRNKLNSQNLGDSTVQNFGTTRDVSIRIAPVEGINSADLSSKVLAALSEIDTNVNMRKVEFVGPQVGDELTEDGALAVLFALIAILFYVWVRFEWRFSVGSIVALLHDVIITLGVFSFFQLNFDLTVLAAILAVIGYSLNDTIVVFDRIRENFRKMRKGSSMEVIDNSLNQTLSRTLMTSITTLLVLVALLVLGGKVMYGFALALLIGVVIGTYSSVYVASSSILFLGISKEDLIIPEKEEVEQIDLEP